MKVTSNSLKIALSAGSGGLTTTVVHSFSSRSLLLHGRPAHDLIFN